LKIALISLNEKKLGDKLSENEKLNKKAELEEKLADAKIKEHSAKFKDKVKNMHKTYLVKLIIKRMINKS